MQKLFSALSLFAFFGFNSRFFFSICEQKKRTKSDETDTASLEMVDIVPFKYLITNAQRTNKFNNTMAERGANKKEEEEEKERTVHL